MSDTKMTGGAAFPVAETEWGGIYTGMSLLDWFAGKVVSGNIQGHMDPEHLESLARQTFDVAEALVAESEKRQAVEEK